MSNRSISKETYKAFCNGDTSLKWLTSETATRLGLADGARTTKVYSRVLKQLLHLTLEECSLREEGSIIYAEHQRTSNDQADLQSIISENADDILFFNKGLLNPFDLDDANHVGSLEAEFADEYKLIVFAMAWVVTTIFIAGLRHRSELPTKSPTKRLTFLLGITAHFLENIPDDTVIRKSLTGTLVHNQTMQNDGYGEMRCILHPDKALAWRDYGGV
jgi:hypothetical protein